MHLNINVAHFDSACLMSLSYTSSYATNLEDCDRAVVVEKRDQNLNDLLPESLFAAYKIYFVRWRFDTQSVVYFDVLNLVLGDFNAVADSREL
jgi:hypothetical protein